MHSSTDPYDLSKTIDGRAKKNQIPFIIEAEYKPAGDQENAIEKIISQLKIEVPTFKKDKLPTSLKSIPISTPGSRFIK